MYFGKNDDRVKHKNGVLHDSEGWRVFVDSTAYGYARVGAVNNYKLV